MSERRAIDGPSIARAPAGIKLSSGFGLGPGTFDPSVEASVALAFPTLAEICAGLRRKKDTRPASAIIDERVIPEPFTGGWS